MTTSRTGTARWKRVRAQALAQAIEAGITRCPTCGTGLDYQYSRRPNSAEVDHVLPHARGGEDTLENTRIICRWCNQRRGAGARIQTPKRVIPQTRVPW